MSDVFPRIRVVSAPSVTATVHADLMDVIDGASSSVEVLAQDFTLGQLDLEGDPDAIGVEWALQRIGLTQQVRGSKAGARFRMQTLARAFLRRRFWLMFQLDAESAPVWWHAYRTPPGEVDWESVYIEDEYVEFDDPGNDRYLIKGGVDVDPFAYSARVTHPVKVVGNDPAGAAPASGYTLPAIRGDAPTRLRVKITPSTTSRAASKWLVACVASNTATPIVDSPIGAGDGLTAAPSNPDGTGTGEPTARDGAVGGSFRRVTNLPTGNSPERSLTGSFPVAGAPAGQYLMMLRAATPAPFPLTFTAQIRSVSGFPLAPAVTATLVDTAAAGENYQWISLGVIGLGDNLPEDLRTGLFKRSLSLWFSGLSGQTRPLHIDHVRFVPVEGSGISTSLLTAEVAASVTEGAGPSSTFPLLIDGDNESDLLINGQDGEYLIANSGGFPEADPGAAFNTLLVMPLASESASDSPTDLGQTAQVEVSYHPRSVWLGDGINPVTDVVTLNV